MKVGEIFIALGFDVDTADLNTFDRGLKAVRNELLMVTGVVTAALFALDRFIDGSTRGAAALTNFNAATGLSIQKLQQWQNAANLSNFSIGIEQVASSIESLQSNLTQLRLGQGNASPFQLLGIDPTSYDAFKVLDQVREKIKGLDRPLAVNLIQQMGLSPDMIQVLSLSRQEFDKLGNSFSRSRGMTKALMDLGNAINGLKQRFLLWKDNFVLQIAPFVFSLLKGLQDVANAVGNVTYMLQNLVKTSPQVVLFLKAMAFWLGVLTAAAFPITAALGALLLVLDDIAVYNKGGKSVIGQLVEWFQGLKEIPWVTEINDLLDRIENFKMPDWLGGKTVGENKKSFDDNTLLGGLTEGGLSGFFGKLLDFQHFILQQVPQNVAGNAFTNTFIINSTGDPAAIANQIGKQLQTQFNYGVADTNNGVVN